MRITPLAIVLGLAASSLSVPGAAQQTARTIDPVSVQLLDKGKAALAAKDYEAADDALEAALVADPANRAAFVAMARVAMAQGLDGQAYKMARKALTLEPTDRAALQVQTEALVAMGATEKARANRALLAKLCPDGCAELSATDTVIAKGSLAEVKVGAEAKPGAEARNN